MPVQGCLRAGCRPGHSFVHDRRCCLCPTAHCNNGKSSSVSGDRGGNSSSRCSGTGSRSSGSSTAGSEASSHKGGGKQQPDWNSMTQVCVPRAHLFLPTLFLPFLTLLEPAISYRAVPTACIAPQGVSP